MTTKEVLDLVLKLSKENKKILGDYKTAMAQLDAAVKKVEKSELKFFVVHKTPITIGLTLLFVFLFLFAIFTTMRVTDTCVVNVSKKETALAIKSCKEVIREQETLQKTN